MTALLFTYGTLQLPAVQRAVFGREITGRAAVLIGFRRETVRIADETVVGLSGATEHPILVRTNDPADRIHGAAYALDDAQLAAADVYETDAYARLPVTLASGEAAFVYARAEP